MAGGWVLWTSYGKRRNSHKVLSKLVLLVLVPLLLTRYSDSADSNCVGGFMPNHGPYKVRYLLVSRYFSTRRQALAYARRMAEGGHSAWVIGPDWGDEKHTSYIREIKKG